MTRQTYVDEDQFPDVEVLLEAPHRFRPFARVYEIGTPPNPSFTPTYSFNMPFAELQKACAYTAAEVTTVRQANEWCDEATVSARSRVRPEVVPMFRDRDGDLFPDLTCADLLADELRLLEARNLSKDAIFSERTVLLTVRAYRFDFQKYGAPRNRGVSLSLLKVGVLL